ncbi:hypothetical protein V6N13_076609 [Hibiscus sabdariffa]
MVSTDFGCIPQTSPIPQVAKLNHAVKSKLEAMITLPEFGNSRERHISQVERLQRRLCKYLVVLFVLLP